MEAFYGAAQIQSLIGLRSRQIQRIARLIPPVHSSRCGPGSRRFWTLAQVFQFRVADHLSGCRAEVIRAVLRQVRSGPTLAELAETGLEGDEPRWTFLYLYEDPPSTGWQLLHERPSALTERCRRILQGGEPGVYGLDEMPLSSWATQLFQRREDNPS
jgi:hypothetical protein